MIEVDIVGLDAFNVQVNYDLETVAEAIRQDVENNVVKQRTYDNSPLTPLKPNYKKLKEKKLGHSRIFDGFRKSGKLIDSIMLRKINNEYFEIYVGNNNSDIMGYLQAGKKPMAGPRRGFGIGESGLKRIARLMKESIIIRNG